MAPTRDCLRPYDSTERDISSPDLWLRSLERSRHRREIAELDRRYSARRKSVSAVVSAAMLTAPAMPRIAMAQGASSSDRTEQPTGRQAAVILRLGNTGPGVSELQKRLGGLATDGIFGPKTAAAVRDFQARHGLAVTGVVEMETWAALFGSNVSVIDEGSPQAQEILARGASSKRGPASTLAGAQAASAQADTVAAAIAPASTVAATPPDPAPAPAREVRALKERTAPARTAPARPVAARPAPARPVATPPPAPAPKAPARPAPATTPTSGGGGPCSPGKFVSPVSNYTVSGTFGEDRGDHIHTGLDMVAPSGTPIHAASCGRVTDASSAGGYGNLVCIRHSGGFSTCYAHLSRFGVSAGQYVRVGQVIGYVGCTGNCSGPHVHYEVRHNGTPRDPSPYVKARSASASRASSPSRTRAVKATSRSTSASKPANRSSAVAAAQPPATAPSEPVAAEPAPESQPAVAPESTSVGAAGADGAAGTDGADAAPASEPAATEAAPAAEAAPVDASTSETVPPEAAAEPEAEAPATDVASPVDSLPAVTAQDSAPAEPAAPESQASDPKPPSDQASAPEPEKPAVETPAVPAEAAEAAAAVPAAATEAAASAKGNVTDAASAATGSATQEEPAPSPAASDGADSPSAPAEPAAGSPTPAR